MISYKINDDMTPWSEERMEEILSLVSQQRREKAIKYSHKSGRQLSLMAYRLLQDMLAEVYGITEPPIFQLLENGKPVIVGHKDIHFNLSHCRNGVACAVSDHPIGIDIESIPQQTKDGLAEYVFNDYELQMLKESPSPTLTFTRLWTMKEAVVKLSGRGLTGKEQLRPLLQAYHDGCDEWVFHTIENQEKGFVCTIAEEKR